MFLPPLCSMVLCFTQPGISRPILDPTTRKGYLAYTRTSIHGDGNGIPLQDSCLENPVDGGAWWAAVHRVKQIQTQLKRLSMHACMHLRRKWQPTLVSLPGESHGQRSLVGCRLWGCTESDTTEVTRQQ